jgi:hypothetical protein
MTNNLKRQLQNNGQWDYTNNCPIAAQKAPEYTPQFLGERCLIDKYQELSEVCGSHELLKYGKIVDGHFKFNHDFCSSMGIDCTGNIKNRHILEYILSLKEAIKAGEK